MIKGANNETIKGKHHKQAQKDKHTFLYIIKGAFVGLLRDISQITLLHLTKNKNTYIYTL